VNAGQKPGALAPRSSALFAEAPRPWLPRLLDLAGAAFYLSVSSWTVSDREAAGVLSRVRVPMANGGELRKLLFDREALGRFIETNKTAAEATRKAP
jgi:hypothetical protein